MIFGFLTKFSILVYFFRIKNKFFRNLKKSWKSIEKIFFEIFLETKNFHWKINIKFSWKIENFQKIFRFFTKIVYWFFNENFWFPKKSRKLFFRYFFKMFCSKKYTKIRNLVRNPKIILRKPCEHFKIV